MDGFREVQRAIAGGIEFESVFLPADSDATDQDYEWTQLNANIYTVSERALAKIAFGQRQEVVAVAPTPKRNLEQLSLCNAAKIAVLEAIEKPGNVGAIMRSADGAGMDAVVLVDSQTDLFNPNAIRASLGTIFLLQVASTTFDEYARWVSQQNLHHFLAKCESDTLLYTQADFSTACAIVLGNEANGLSDKWATIPTKSTNINIPMRGIADSLNVAATASVLFYEAVK